MKPLKLAIYFFLITCFNSCWINRFKFDSHTNLKNPIEIEFCNLQKFDSSRLIKVKAILSGVEEYWSLHNKQDCDINGQVNFYFDEESSKRNIINGYFLNKRLKKVYYNYDKYAVEMEIVGKLETDFQNGFGHLGTNKFQLNAKKVRIVRFINRKNI